MEQALSILYAAALVESIINVIKNLRNREDADVYYWASLVASILISVLVSYNWDLDLFSMLLGEGRIPLVGAVLTGFIASRGSNVVHDLILTLEGFKNRFKNNPVS
jgi:hypothetical protein